VVIGDRDDDAQPAVGGVELDELRHLATRANAITGGIDPESQEDLGVGGGCAGDLAAGADVGVSPAQIELINQGAAWPDDSELREAIRDQEDSFRRTLLPGDTEAIPRDGETLFRAYFAALLEKP